MPSPPALADLPTEQTELWRHVQRLWELVASKDARLIRQALHPRCAGGETYAPVPHDREAAVSSITGEAPRLRRPSSEPCAADPGRAVFGLPCLPHGNLRPSPLPGARLA